MDTVSDHCAPSPRPLPQALGGAGYGRPPGSVGPRHNDRGPTDRSREYWGYFACKATDLRKSVCKAEEHEPRS